MNRRRLLHWCCGLVLLGFATGARGQWRIHEALFNPPGADTTNEFVELVGPPNSELPAGTWLVSVEGDANGDPGTVQNRFDLSGRRIGQNGFLVLLQKFHRYTVNPLASVVTNADHDGGWGLGASSGVRHDGEGGQIDLENPSFTLFLIHTATAPPLGEDIDANDDGVIDAVVLNRWTIYDSVGVLDGDGAGDMAYGRINFRRDQAPGSGATVATGTVVPVPFTPAYVGRLTNSTGWTAAEWVASDNLLGTAPRWFLGANYALTRVTNTLPRARARASLNHLGSPNFGARPPPAVLVRETAGGTRVIEGGLRDSYRLNLTRAPTGAVMIRLEADAPLQFSLDGVRFTNSRTLRFTTTASRRIIVRVPDDRLAGPSPRVLSVRHTITDTRDPGRYPTNTLILPVAVTVVENDPVILSEAKVNPPGLEDAPQEYLELTGPPGMAMTNLWLLAVQGGSTAAGTVALAVNLTGARFGTNGLLLVAASNAPLTLAPGTALLPAPQFARPGGTLPNDSLSLLLVGSTTPILEGADLDAGNNGVLEGLPAGASILDAVAWTDGGGDDVTFGGVDLTQRDYVPDAATRLRGSNAPLSAASWAVGDLLGTDPASLTFDYDHLTPNLPPGSTLSPGVIHRSAPRFGSLTPLSHVIGHPENATVTFSVSDPLSPAATIHVTATSTNPAVVPDANLRLTRVSGAVWSLALDPVGVGYSDIILTASSGPYAGRGVLRYAASAADRPGGHWHSGVSDASTAIAIDSNWVLIGDDENQNIRIFSRNRSGPAVKTIRLNAFLDLVDLYGDGSPKEVDIEGSFRAGNRIFWMGSHSHSMDLLERTNRARIFATDLIGSGTGVTLAVLGHYDFLKLDLIAWDAENRHGRGSNHYGLAAGSAVGVDPKAADGSGFNMEGLCAPPGGGTVAWLGFRAPLVPPGQRTHALIVPVLNYTTLAIRGGAAGSATFGPPIELDLGRRGIRSIEGSGTNYLIVAGPPGGGTNLPPPANFKLFTWTGRTNDAPRERSTDLWGLSPEALIGVPPLPWTSNSPVHLVSDNGAFDFYNDGQQAKHLPVREFKKFRIDTVPLGEALPPAPQLRAVRLNQQTATVEWQAEPGQTYRLQCKSRMDQPDWTEVPGDIVADGPTASASVPRAVDGPCFFRVVLVPRH